jgi:hypothetical protein
VTTGLLGCLVVIAGLAAADGQPAADARQARPPGDNKQGAGQLQLGMTMAEVREALGGREPKRIARQILYGRYLEQWVYEDPSPVVIEFDCPKGRTPHVVNLLLP